MSDRSIAQLSPADALQNTDLIPIWQDNGTKRMTAAQLGSYFSGGGGPSAASVTYCRLSLSAPSPNFTNDTAAIWTAVDAGDATLWDAGSPTRLTVPTSGALAVVSAGWTFKRQTAANRNQFYTRKNGTPFNGMAAWDMNRPASGTIFPTANITTGVLPVSGGDYFELFGNTNPGTTWMAEFPDTAWFCLQIIGWT